MPGYGGQEIALDVNDSPLDIVSPLSKVQAYQTQQNENQYRSALTDSISQGTQERQQLFPSQLQVAQNNAAQNTAAWQREQIGRAMGAIDPNDPNAADKWDAAMRKLSAQGISDAGQYIGRYSPDRQQRLTAAYTADNALSALANLGAGATPDAQLTPEQTRALDARFSNYTPQQLQASYGRFEQIKQALNQVANSPNPAATWAQLAPQFGHNEPFSWQSYKDAWSQIAPMDTYLRGRINEANAKAPAPIVPKERVEANGIVYQVDPVTQKLVPATTKTVIAQSPAGPVPVQEGAGVQPGANLTGGVWDDIEQATRAAGGNDAEGDYLKKVAYVESGGNPNAPESKAHARGLFQIQNASSTDVGEQTRETLQRSRQDRARLIGAGIDPTDENTYLLHQQGPRGGMALLRSDPNANVIDALAPAYNGDRRLAQQAVTNNGGRPDMTAGQFVDLQRGKFDQATGAGSGVVGNVKVGQPLNGQGGLLTDDAINDAADQYIGTGKLPQLGNAGRYEKAQIMNRVSAKLRQYGLSASDVIENQGVGKAAGQALTKIVGLKAQIDSNERTANDNANLMLSLAPQGAGPTPLPPLNRAVQAARKGTGDPSVVKFDAALGTFLDEYAKVMTSSTGSGGVTSDSARSEAYSRLSKYASQGQLRAGVQVMQQEMQNRTTELDRTEQGLRSTLAGTVPHAAQASQSTGQGGQASSRNPGGAGFTDAQRAAFQHFQGATADPGTRDNPRVPVSKAQYDAIPAGSWYIDTDGLRKRKGGAV